MLGLRRRAPAFWLSITRPVGSTDAGVATTAGPSASHRLDLAEDEVWLGDISLNAGSVVAAGTPLLDVVGTGTGVTSGPGNVPATST
jgi:hypothetical protein